MKKKLIFAAAAIAMLASCSQNDLEAPVVGQAQQSDAIEFGTYLGKAAGSRAGYNDGTMTTATMASNGFGVFAYYTEGNPYPNVAASAPGSINANDFKPNFMYNQKVTSASDPYTAWTYSPLKYWPNEIAAGNVDGQPATGAADKGKVSFFAYAPWVDHNASLGTSGITALSGNDAAGNPTVTYAMDPYGKNVDLLWGVFKENTSSVIGSNDLTGGKVWGNEGATIKNYGTTNVNMFKQQKDQKVKFTFQHALAKVGGANGVQVKVDPDEGDAFGNETNAETFVTVNSITLTKAGTKQKTGTLDLATGIWTLADPADADPFVQTIVPLPTSDQVKLNVAIAEPTTTFSDPQSNQYWVVNGTSNLKTSEREGVTKTYKNVYDTDVDPLLLYFPGETPEIEVRIVYTVRTKDKSLAKGYSEVVQDIKKNVTFTSVERGKWYKLNIILGLTSVKFEGVVTDWDNAAGANDKEVYLPLNVN